MNIIFVILLSIAISGIIIAVMKSELECPPPKIIYKLIPKHAIDTQFSDENKPSTVYNEMFDKSSPWIGGYYISDSKTYVKN